MFNFIKKKKDPNILEIKYNLSSGIPFKWEWEVEDQTICNLVKCTSHGEQSKEPICGGKVETTYFFQGLKSGTTKIIFKCINFADNVVSEIDEYTVTVDQKLKIKLTSKENIKGITNYNEWK